MVQIVAARGRQVVAWGTVALALRGDDYIQGTPVNSGRAVAFRRTAANMVKGPGFCQTIPANPTCVPLQFSNVDAEFYGVDACEGSTHRIEHHHRDGALSWHSR